FQAEDGIRDFHVTGVQTCALPICWVIHTVGPNFAAGNTDRSLLVSCYRRSLEVAEELGARSVAFPLVSAGIYGWPREDAIRVARSEERRVGEECGARVALRAGKQE